MNHEVSRSRKQSLVRATYTLGVIFLVLGLVLPAVTSLSGDVYAQDPPWSNLTPADRCLAYGVHDPSNADSQFFSLNLDTGEVGILNQTLYMDYDFESLQLVEVDGDIYLVSISVDGDLYAVDAADGSIELLGNIGFDDTVSLSDVDGTLWATANRDLIEVDPFTASATLIDTLQHRYEGSAWNSGVLYLANSSVSPEQLWVYDPNTGEDQPVTDQNGETVLLPGNSEAFDTWQNYLLGGLHQEGQPDDVITIFAFDLNNLAAGVVEEVHYNTGVVNDIEGLVSDRFCGFFNGTPTPTVPVETPTPATETPTPAAETPTPAAETPTPTSTPEEGETPTPTNTPQEAGETPSPTPTNTPQQVDDTPSPRPTNTPQEGGETPSPRPTNTPQVSGDTPTPGATSTPVAAGETPQPTPTGEATPGVLPVTGDTGTSQTDLMQRILVVLGLLFLAGGSIAHRFFSDEPA